MTVGDLKPQRFLRSTALWPLAMLLAAHMNLSGTFARTSALCSMQPGTARSIWELARACIQTRSTSFLLLLKERLRPLGRLS